MCSANQSNAEWTPTARYYQLVTTASNLLPVAPSLKPQAPSMPYPERRGVRGGGPDGDHSKPLQELRPVVTRCRTNIVAHLQHPAEYARSLCRGRIYKVNISFKIGSAVLFFAVYLDKFCEHFECIKHFNKGFFSWGKFYFS